MDLQLFFTLSSDALFVGDFLGRIREVNPAAAEMQGVSREELIGRSFISLAHPMDLPRVAAQVARLAAGQTTVSFETRVRNPAGYRWFLWSATPVISKGLFYAIGKDITDAKALAEEREKLVAELTQALESVRTLSGLLPICSYCQRVRDDRGYWTEVQTYVTRHTDASFSHGICQECMAKHFPEFPPEAADTDV